MTSRDVSAAFERKYGMSFSQFNDYLRERAALLVSESLSPEERRALNQAIMQEEDDWLDWKAAEEMPDVVKEKDDFWQKIEGE